MKKFLLSYFFFSFFFFSFFASGFVDSQDGFQYLTITRRMYYDHTFEMPEELYPDENIHMSLMDSSDGKLYSPTGLGYSLSLLPAVFLEDVFLKMSRTEMISAFPLQNDWPVLLFASMTNSFWAALFVVFMYQYLKEIDLKHKQAVLLSFLFSIGTNVFVYSKHTFAHMMFVSMMTATFLFLKKYTKTKKKLYLFLCGLSYGIVVLSYNPTYLLVLPALGFYYLFLVKFKLSLIFIKNLIQDILIASLGFIPFLLSYMWFNSIRFGGVDQTGYGSFIPLFPPAYIIIEGIWGILLSPGKSIFIYSPILLIIILFWFKLKKKILPEIVAAGTLFFIYLWNIGTLLGNVDYPVWHGDSSWGPRYMLPILPLLLILIGFIYKEVSKKQRYFVFYPLLLLGFYINLLSVLLPYQIRFAGLQTDAFINNRNFNVYEYGNELARYAPSFKLSKTLFKRVKNIKNTYSHGKYNLRLSDGFDAPFDLGWAVWRGMRPLSVIKFNNSTTHPINKLSLQIKNHQMDPDSEQNASFKYVLNGTNLNEEELIADIEEEFILNISSVKIKDKNNELLIFSSFESSTSAQLKKKQSLFLQLLRINDSPQNISTIDYPYVSDVSKGLNNIEYNYWGNLEQDSWSIWHMHSGVYEQTFDLWWLRPFHYWDLPKDVFMGLMLINLSGIISFGFIVYSKD
jgi:hypothetical protein